MSARTLRYWPFDVLPESDISATQRVLTSFFDETLATGHAPYVDSTWSLIGFGDLARREAQYVNRGRNRYWEPWLGDSGSAIRLGPIFGLSDTHCVVFDGYADLVAFTRRWLAGASLDASLLNIAIFDRHDPRVALDRCA